MKIVREFNTKDLIEEMLSKPGGEKELKCRDAFERYIHFDDEHDIIGSGCICTCYTQELHFLIIVTNNILDTHIDIFRIGDILNTFDNVNDAVSNIGSKILVSIEEAEKENKLEE